MKNSQLRFTKEHEWIKLISPTKAIVGITDYAQRALGDIVYVEYPAVGSTLKKDASFGVVESIKSVSDLYSPVNGLVTAINTEITDQWEMINQDPYQIWLVELELQQKDIDSLNELMDERGYQEFTQSSNQ